MSSARDRGHDGGVVGAAERLMDRRIERSVRKLGVALYLFVFMGAGIATGYVAFHAASVGKYWYVPVAYDAVALLAGGLLLAKARKAGRRLVIETVVGMLVSFGVGVWLGAVAT